jgi:nucleotide-binding universal stress UspA family protein
MYRKILLAYDGSSFSDPVLRQGAELASLCKAEVHLLGIVGTTGAVAIAESFGPSDVLGFEQRELQQLVDAAVEGRANRD